MTELLKSLDFHLGADKKICDRASEAFVTIRDNWVCEAADMIECKGYFNWTLKLVAQVAWRSDVPNRVMAFQIVHAQVVCRLTEYKNWYALRRYITLDDWLQAKNLPVSSRELIVEELAEASVHINPEGELSSEVLILPLLPSPSPPPSALLLPIPPLLPPPSPAPPPTAPPSPALPSPNRLTPSPVLPNSNCQAPSTPSKPSSTLPTPKPSALPLVPPNSNCLALSTPPKSSSTTNVDDWLKYLSCLGLGKLWCQDILSDVTLDLVGCVSVLGHFYYEDQTFCHRHLCLLTNTLQLEPSPDLQLCGRMRELFRNGMSLSSLAACVDSNRGWFIPNL